MEFGISVALLTPFEPTGHINTTLLCEHAVDLLGRGVGGVTLFGTTGEGASIGTSERPPIIAALSKAGVSPSQLTLGISGCAVSGALEQVRQGTFAGVTNFLLLPPFYFKGLDDEGLFDWHAQIFQNADSSARFILYHIPQVTNIPLSFDLVMRLKKAFPRRVLAIKDSSGSWDNTRALIESREIPVLVGDERLLHQAAALGAVGSICGMANLYPERMCRLFETRIEDKSLSAEVDAVVAVPVIPALKSIMAHRTHKRDWDEVRAPLVQLAKAARADLLSKVADRVSA